MAGNEMLKVSEAVDEVGDFDLTTELSSHLGYTKPGKFGSRAKWGFETKDGVLVIVYTPKGITPKELDVRLVGLDLPKAKKAKSTKSTPKAAKAAKTTSPKGENGEKTVTLTESKIQEMMAETAEAAAKAAVDAIVGS